MGRPRRPQAAGAFFHVTTRGNNRRSIYSDDFDRIRFLVMIGKVCERYEWRCLSYCLMGNHYHLVIRAMEPTLSLGMQWLNGGYARGYNVRHARQDHLFGKRFHSELIEDEPHSLELARYVVLNPIRAGICARPEQWKWSSFCATAGLGNRPGWFRRKWLLGQFDDDLRVAAAKYVAFVYAALE